MNEKFILAVLGLGLVFGFFLGYTTRKYSDDRQYIEYHKEGNEKFYKRVKQQFNI
jgi:hypothetical protein